jgi:hypothetical protein
MKSASKKRAPTIVNLTVKRRYLTEREVERLMDSLQMRYSRSSEIEQGSPNARYSVDARPREFSKCKRTKLTGKHVCGRSHQSYFSLSKNQGLRFSLYRDVDVPDHIRHDGLSLDELKAYSTHGNFVARMVADASRPGLCTNAARPRCSPGQRAEENNLAAGLGAAHVGSGAMNRTVFASVLARGTQQKCQPSNRVFTHLLRWASHERGSAFCREIAHCRSLIPHSRLAVSVSCASGLGGVCS